MKPHFGQSDAAMNKLAGCNSFPNSSKGLEQIAELEAKAREAGFNTPFEYLRAQHESAAGMGLEPEFFERLITENFTPEPLPKGYFGHEDGCDCAVCEQAAWDDGQRKLVDAEWNKLLDDNKRLTVLLDAEQKNVAYAQQKWSEAEERSEKYKSWYESLSEASVKERDAAYDLGWKDCIDKLNKWLDAFEYENSVTTIHRIREQLVKL